MPILLLIGLLISPRLVIVLLALLSTWFETAGVGLIGLILGTIFMPVTLLWYSVVANWFGGEWGILQIVVLVLAVMIDLGGSYGYTRHYHVVETVVEE